MDQNEQNLSSKPPKFRFRFLLFPIPIILGFIALSLGFGCGMGGGDYFTCNVAGQSVYLGFIVSLITLIVIFTTTYPKRVSNSVRIIFTLSFVIPIILLSLPNILSENVAVKYLEGLTPEACATQKPIVPWGKRFINPDSCYGQFNMCDKIQDYYSEGLCYSRTTTFKTHSDCDVYKNWNNKLDCNVRIATLEKDFDFCSSITIPTVPTGSFVEAPNPSYVYTARHRCAMDVSGQGEEILNEVVKHDYESDPYRQASYCMKFANIVGRDLCYAEKAYRSQFDGGLCAKITNTIPWLRKNCESSSSKD